ncbi:MAG: ABC transporter permease subunit [Pseudanabaenaceae cyanobacterium]|jgi:general L-amino acid transport system permease protein
MSALPPDSDPNSSRNALIKNQESPNWVASLLRGASGEPSPPVAWVQENLFSSWGNGLLTLVCLWLLYQGGHQIVNWVATARWQVITSNFPLFFTGLYPAAELWRIGVVLAMVAGLAGLSWGFWDRLRRGIAVVLGALVIIGLLVSATPLWFGIWGLTIAGGFGLGQWLKGKDWSWRNGAIALGWFGSVPMALWLMGGGLFLGKVEADLWNGLLLTLCLAVLGIGLSFPLGVLLALGRQGQLPIIKWVCVAYIELVRGLPLIGVLFMAQVMLPLFFPAGWEVHRVVRAVAAYALFSAAYLAENVRGGLQSLPKGQTEAAKALGFNPLLITTLIVLPQALRLSVPSIVGQFIALFKDTSLVAMVGLVDLMGVARTVLSQPEFIGRYSEVYLFTAGLYWIFCYSMSQASRKLEQGNG